MHGTHERLLAFEARIAVGEVLILHPLGNIAVHIVEAPGVKRYPLEGLSLPARAIWYVLDEESGPVHKLRAQRGEGGKSWVRARTLEAVRRLFLRHPELLERSGLFVSPFVAQARSVAELLSNLGATGWQASTTPAQQGAEAEVVLFDTVHAGSTAWPPDEWRRLVNVGMSRAKQLLIFYASRLEMSEPFLRPLARELEPMVLRGNEKNLRWAEVPGIGSPARASSSELGAFTSEATKLGDQLAQRKGLRPILGTEQERLCGLAIDGKPRLVRGVAGSGKTAVLAHWLVQHIARQESDGPYWVVYANRSLGSLLESIISDAWCELRPGRSFPWTEVEFLHVAELLTLLEGQSGLPASGREHSYDFDWRAQRLERTAHAPRCTAMFIDEAQDFGPRTLALLAQLVMPSDSEDPRKRPIHIFYDNAQNLYGRGTPRWVELGIDVQGRSTVMKESYRSTRPITEFALNVLYWLTPPERDGRVDPDHAELVRRGLIEREQRGGRDWWRVHYNSVEGPLPELRVCASRDAELAEICAGVRRLLTKEKVRSSDIRIVVNGSMRAELVQRLRESLTELEVPVEERARERLDAEDGHVVVTTAHSLKGHESEVVIVACADRFVMRRPENEDERWQPLSSALYVALTRARSLLWISATRAHPGSVSERIVDALESCAREQR